MKNQNTEYRSWISGSPRGAAILVHGLGANIGWWEGLAGVLLTAGVSSCAVNLSRSGSMREFKNGIAVTLGRIRKENPGEKVFAVGESLGGLAVFSMAASGEAAFDGIICMSPAFKSSLKLGLLDYVRIFLPLLYSPGKKQILPMTPEMCTRDPEYIRLIKEDYDKDTMSSSRLLFDIFKEQLAVGLSRAKIAAGILCLIGGEDRMVDSAATKRIIEKTACPDKRIIEYPGMYHSLSIELGREKVFTDIVRWLEDRLGSSNARH